MTRTSTRPCTQDRSPRACWCNRLGRGSQRLGGPRGDVGCLRTTAPRQGLPERSRERCLGRLRQRCVRPPSRHARSRETSGECGRFPPRYAVWRCRALPCRMMEPSGTRTSHDGSVLTTFSPSMESRSWFRERRGSGWRYPLRRRRHHGRVDVQRRNRLQLRGRHRATAQQLHDRRRVQHLAVRHSRRKSILSDAYRITGA